MFYFLLRKHNGAKQANYQHAAIVFAEGLKQLNITYAANIDYFPDPEGNHLFTGSNTLPEGTKYVVTVHPEDFKTEILTCEQQNLRLIIFDSKDEWVRHESLAMMPLAYKYFMTTKTPQQNDERIKPLCFAACNRMIETIAKQSTVPWSDRIDKIFWAHRVDNHRIRNFVKSFYDKTKTPYHTHLDNFIEPKEESHYWTHTGRRHNPHYFAELQKYKYMDAHGGYQSNSTIVQWDSWKVWEGFLSGMLVITADLDYYQISLPYKLIPYKHYIPVRYDKIQESYDKLSRLSETEKAEIAAAGQKYALENYCPRAMANYILESLQEVRE